MSNQIENTETCFEDCPKCDGELHYPTGMGDCICQDCGAEYLHEKRTTQHLLWMYDDDYHVDEVVDRAK